MDRSAKVLMGIIAAGLWANAAILAFQPIKASAQSDDLGKILTHVGHIAADVAFLTRGGCSNPKLCAPLQSK
jgi:hypothetical protein